MPRSITVVRVEDCEGVVCDAGSVRGQPIQHLANLYVRVVHRGVVALAPVEREGIWQGRLGLDVDVAVAGEL